MVKVGKRVASAVGLNHAEVAVVGGQGGFQQGTLGYLRFRRCLVWRVHKLIDNISKVINLNLEFFDLLSELFYFFFLVSSQFTYFVITFMEKCTGFIELTSAKVDEVPAHPGVSVDAGHHATLYVLADLHDVLLPAMRLELAES